MFPKMMGIFPQNGWFIMMENPMNKWMIWGENPYFLETTIHLLLVWSSPIGNSMTPVWENSFWCMSLPELFPVILVIGWFLCRFKIKIRYSKTLDFSWPSKNLINLAAFFLWKLWIDQQHLGCVIDNFLPVHHMHGVMGPMHFRDPVV